MARQRRDLSDRQQQRDAVKQKRIQEQKRLRRRFIMMLVILFSCAAAVFIIAKNNKLLVFPEPGETQVQEETSATEQTEAPTEDPHRPKHQPVKTIHIRAAGDLNVTSNVVDSGRVGKRYDFTQSFIDVQALLSEADWTVLNFEGNICGEPYGSETRSAPAELLTALVKAGVDMVQTANSYSVHNGLIGMTATLQSIRNSGLIPIGSYTSPQEFARRKGYDIVTIGGVKVAFVAFTKGVGGMGMPAGNEDCVNLLYEDYDSTYQKVDKKRITRVLRAAEAEKPDITIAMLHWGSEYNDKISKTQEEITELMMAEGVDVILGSHPHTVQKIVHDKEAGTLIAYSLGDFYGDANRAGTNYSIILDLEITKDEAAATCKVTDFSYFPIYTLSQEEREEKNSVIRQVVRIGTAMQARDGNFVDRVTADAYNSMQYSLTRITDRVRNMDEIRELEKEEQKKQERREKKKNKNKDKEEKSDSEKK